METVNCSFWKSQARKDKFWLQATYIGKTHEAEFLGEIKCLLVGNTNKKGGRTSWEWWEGTEKAGSWFLSAPLIMISAWLGSTPSLQSPFCNTGYLETWKTRSKIHFLHRQMCSTRHYAIKETVSPHSLPGGGLVSTWVTPAKVTRNTGMRPKVVPFYPGLSLLFLLFWWKYFLGPY